MTWILSILGERLRQTRLIRSITRRRAGAEAARTGAGLLRAGDIARAGGERRKALRLYGRAIDAFLRAGLPHDAELVCRRVLDLDPDVVRARYTLTAIAVGRGRVGLARERLADYVEAVTRAQAPEVAVPPLLELASATSHPALRRAIASAVREVGRFDYAERVERPAPAAAPAAPSDWERAMRAATKRPGQVDVEALTAV